MLCPKCKNLLRIAASRVEVTGDDDPDIPTQVFLVQDLVCRTKKCPNYEKVVKQCRTKTYPAKEE